MPGQSDIEAMASADEPVEPVEEPDTAEQPPADDAEAGGETPHREAAKYRTRLREVETERDGLSAQLDAMRRAEVVRVAGDGLARGDDLLTYRGDDVAPYLGDDGTVDAEKVAAAVTELVAERGHYLTGKRFVGTADSGHMGKPIGTQQPQRMGSIFSDDAA
jgi:hypothetical protein